MSWLSRWLVRGAMEELERIIESRVDTLVARYREDIKFLEAKLLRTEIELKELKEKRDESGSSKN